MGLGIDSVQRGPIGDSSVASGEALAPEDTQSPQLVDADPSADRYSPTSEPDPVAAWRTFSGADRPPQTASSPTAPPPPTPRDQVRRDLEATQGYAKMSAPARDRLMAYVGGENTFVSQPARAAITQLVQSPAFCSADADGQRKQLEDFLTNQPSLYAHVAEAPPMPSAARAPYRFTGIDTALHTFEGGVKASSTRYDVQIDGRRLPVFLAQNPNRTGGAVFTTDFDAMRALSTLPRANRDLVREIDIAPDPRPEDAKKPASARAYMTAGADGVVSIYPTQWPTTADYMRGSMAHETGHAISMRAWGGKDDPRWRGWEQAMTSDGLAVSTYARSGKLEDFAETFEMYQLARGTPTELELRALFPARYRLIDGLLGRNPSAP